MSNKCFGVLFSLRKKKKSTYVEVFMRDLYGVRHAGLFFGFHDAAP